ncbi:MULTISPECIES: heme o synthase [Bacillus]|jgi:protoheme IX farnesyltransferase|uniref:Protoheme IX farnesyltransferase 2 n=5 Tax=Bacillus amyloliquefaciens group TaxID=1938374 RepID=COXX2_BACVZ|nr:MULTISPECIES: heme o synthase [Bacillus]A7Z4B1.1 RecName: Full=Protoheme IX farnesyltransferase 2; AltName: Full=Heme B farnesyltransferase 2; AltName: Full=Heme O synthase 2 [Bacillus velezensis FZB42]AIU76909.1 protoheme IX farnesyltransferase [Bacillus subtilis]ARM27676.1 protoheme IX farnesyltransferase 2 [Bacillus vallismortis]MBL3613249.1 protoheme IX farnesyltransferase [Bacillus sp. RHFS18]COC42008.1 Protoheme IX farnesyltransferase 2 [Streptococcus pneumoniae]SLB30027.1 cytochrome
MANSRILNDTAIDGQIEETTAWKDFLSLIKIGIVNSNLITTFTGMWLALHISGLSFLGNLNTVLLTLIGSSLIIAGSCAVNNYYDRDIDHLMERTKVRPTVTGKIQPNQALWSGILLIALGLIMLLMTTVMAAVIGFIGVFTYVVLYTMWTKRRYTINTVVGSVSGAVPPLIGWTAVEGHIGVVAWVLFMILFIWQIPHFLALAIKKTEDYRAANIPMLPVVHGFEVTKRQIIVWVACLLPLPFFLGSLGLPIVILGTLLNVGWLVLGLMGFRMKNIMKWATLMFVYSLNYMTIYFVAMVVFTLF